MCWALESGLTLAKPVSDSPLLVVLLLPELELALLLLLLDPQAASPITHAISATGVSVSRNRRIS
jgi:hypothetical protein